MDDVAVIYRSLGDFDDDEVLGLDGAAADGEEGNTTGAGQLSQPATGQLSRAARVAQIIDELAKQPRDALEDAAAAAALGPLLRDANQRLREVLGPQPPALAAGGSAEVA